MAHVNEYHKALMSAPSLTPGWCVVCGAPYPTRHHVVRRSQGGHDGPVLHLHGSGTRGCHGDAERLCLHFRFDRGWEYLRTPEPLRYAEALDLDGWRPCASADPDRFLNPPQAAGL